MNCDLCHSEIPEAMQVSWNKGNYHPGCVGEAVLQNRASNEPVVPLPELEQLERYDADFFEEDNGEDIEFQDDIDEFEEDFANAIDRFDNEPIIPQIERAENNARNVIIPEVVGNIPAQMGAGNGTLMVHCGAQRISRQDLATLDVPEATSTFKPIAHSQLVDVVEEALAFRHIRITNQEFATSPDGMKLFGVLQVNADYEGVQFAIGLRNANDKSMRVGIVSGYRVFCCDNLAFSGDFNPMLQKHSKNLDLIESVSIAIDRIQRQWQPLRMAIDYKREHFLNDDIARNMFYKLFTEYKLPISLFRTVHKEYFVNPTYQEFSEKTLWSFENAITTAFKKLNPIPRYENTARVGKFIADYIQSAN